MSSLRRDRIGDKLKNLRTLETYVAGRDNNFNLIRVFLAVLVIIHHGFALTSQGSDTDPILKLTGIGIGYLALYCFFILSGFLIAMSFAQRTDPVYYLESRVLRIFPGLIVAVLLNALVIGPLFTSLPVGEYFRQWPVYEFILVNSTLILERVQLRYFLPGVFQNNPYGPAVNGSLWTLPYEIWMYVLLFAIGLVGLLKNRKWFNWMYAAFFVQLVVGQLFFRNVALIRSLSNYMLFAAFFLSGAFYYMNRKSIPLNGYLGLFLLVMTVLLRNTRLYQVALLFAVIYWIFLAAYLPGGIIRRYNQLGDYSYGLYIYGFPVQQMIVALIPGISPFALILVSFFCTLVLAVLSWHVIEKPALKLKGKFSRKLAAQFQRAQS